MDVGEWSLPHSINPNNFPAKLWRLVNNPENSAIWWDSHGEGILIDKGLFEKQILSPSTIPSDNADAFKTTNFSSFVRQLNLYGFRKTDTSNKDHKSSPGESAKAQHFYNPIFKRDHPELVSSLRRLTADNKAKIEAGQDVSCRPPKKSSLHSPTHQELTHPYHPQPAQPGTAHNGTPVPPRYLIRGHGAALSPSVFTADKGIQVSVSHHYAGVAPSSSAMHVQQGLLARVNHQSVQYQPGYYSPVCQCYGLNLRASQMACSGLQTGSFPPYNYFQASYPVNMFCTGDNNQEPQSKDSQETKKYDINLDTIFQIADEVMKPLPNRCLVKVKTPEKSVPVIAPPPGTFNTSAMKALPVEPIIMSVSGNPSLVKFKPQEGSVVSIPEQLPEDVKSEDRQPTISLVCLGLNSFPTVSACQSSS
ncbi:heat shock factor protein 5 [Labrus mixtus]|uniref:heat shock factor protein 5 n=1 Tax=Labrus mixtus TaxID=508554 RepID=UPI0029BFD1D2|nr:heat shock factor protein 5 [Labrus mixtus]